MLTVLRKPTSLFLQSYVGHSASFNFVILSDSFHCLLVMFVLSEIIQKVLKDSHEIDGATVIVRPEVLQFILLLSCIILLYFNKKRTPGIILITFFA